VFVFQGGGKQKRC